MNLPATLDDASNRIEALISLTEALSDILDAENRALRHRRPSELSLLQSEKARLAAAYAQSIREIASDRSPLSVANNRLVERLREITESFESAARAQQALLDGARVAAEGVLSAITSEATELRPAYGSTISGTIRAKPVAFDDRA